MVEEKKSTSEVDDWLDDTEDSEDFSGELDQDNIDALLGTGLDEVDEDSGNPEDSGDIEEMDQGSIDALLGGDIDETPEEGTEDDPSELDQANIDALLGGDDSSLEEIGFEESDDIDDQTNIDALLESAEGDAPDEMSAVAETAPDEKDDAELDQDNIDALPGGDQKSDEPVPQTETEEEEEEEDADLDIFLGGGAGGDATETDGLEIEQDEIDRLFAGLDDDDDDDDLFQAEEIDFAEVVEGGDEDDFMDLGTDETIEDQTQDTSADEKTTAAGAPEEVEEEEGERVVAQSGLPFIPESFNKTTAAIMGAALILLLGFCLYMFMPSGKDQPAVIPPALTPEVAEQKIETGHPAQKAAVSTNFIPVVSDMAYTMQSTAGEVPITLSVEDKDDNALTYSVISQPLHGRLSGNAPVFTYLPDNTFPGEDRFEYSVSDGKDSSGIATVLIRGPNLAQQALVPSEEELKEPKVLSPKMSLVAGKDVTISTKSTSPIVIDFEKIWQDANSRPLHSKTYLDIDKSGLKGKLIPLAFGKYRYTPDPFYGGTEYIGYRFKKGGLGSNDHLITLDITLGSPSPEIRLAKLEDGYLVGQTVSLDATSSRDEARKSLEFEWSQVDGVPVQLVMMNTEGSMVSFVMPSFFYTEAEAGPSFRLTARDETGKTDTRYVKVPVVSRRQTALWRGKNGLIADDPPMSGRMLPWPYAD